MTSFSIDLGDDTATALREIAEVTAETPDALIRRAVRSWSLTTWTGESLSSGSTTHRTL